MNKPVETPDTASMRDKIVGLSESSGRKSYYPMLQQKLKELQAEIAERRKAEAALRETVERIRQQESAIAEIATHPATFHGILEDAAPVITVHMGQALRVPRASLWVIQKDRLVCVDKFEQGANTHLSGQFLELAAYPKYFAAIAASRVIATSDAARDPRTAEFADNYTLPRGITAMLDVPVYLEGTLEAIICFEDTTVERVWQPDEITFACRIADQVALMLAAQRRRLAAEELRQAHATLKSNLEFTNVLLDAVPIPVYYKDSQRRYLGCNRSFTEFTGLSAEQLRGKTRDDLWFGLASPSNVVEQDLLHHGGRQMYESSIPDKHGQVRDVVCAKQAFSDSSTQISGVIGSFLDISERKHAEAENARLRSLLANIINSMPSVLVGVDAQGRIAQWNQHAEVITGLREAEVRGQPLDHVVPWLHGEMEKVRQSIISKKPVYESKVCRMHGSEHLFEDITIYPLVTNGVEGAVIRIDDVTDRVRIEEMLVQSEKMLSIGGLAAGMAHEINNPLASIMGNIQVIETRLGKPIPQNLQAAADAGTTFENIQRYMELRGIPRMLRSVHESGAQAAQIVSNMLSFSRKGESRRIAADIVELLEKTLDLAATDYDLKKNYDFKKIRIQKEFISELPQVLGTPGTLQQVFLNLLRNGAEAMSEKEYALGEQPCFTLRAYALEQWVRVEIEDNGPGMDFATRKRAFEPFFTTKAPGKGTGLGLSVSYFIIAEGHRGRMNVLSSPGEWTRFVLDLPLAEPAAIAQSTP